MEAWGRPFLGRFSYAKKIVTTKRNRLLADIIKAD